MYDHIGFAVRDFPRSRDFYDKALRPLGYSVLREGDGWAAFGEGGRTRLWIGTDGTPPGGFHFAFEAKSHAEVREFHSAALAAGGKDNGAPGIRAQYHPDYYAAFVHDPDGHNVEAVCRKPEA